MEIETLIGPLTMTLCINVLIVLVLSTCHFFLVIVLPFATFLLEPLARTICQLLQMNSNTNATEPEHETTEPIGHESAKSSTHASLRSNQMQRQQSMAILCYEERFDCSLFFEAAAKLKLQVERISNDLLHPKYQDPGRIHVLKITTLQLTE